MAIELIRTYSALAECEEHLKTTKTKGTLIESYLTEHVLVIFCADIQQCVYKLLENRADLSADTGLRSFVAISGRRILRSANFQKISETLVLNCISPRNDV